MRMFRTSATLLLLSFACRPGFAEPVELGRVGVAAVSYEAERGLRCLQVPLDPIVSGTSGSETIAVSSCARQREAWSGFPQPS